MNADVIVLGLGGMGAAAAWQLAERGAKVLGFEQFAFNHTLGSSHGETRIIRQAYFEHSNYVPLALRAYEQWRKLEAVANERLLHETGLILAGPPAGEAIAGALGSARLHGLRVERLTPRDARRRWPMFTIRDDQAVVFEPAAGYLPVERCVDCLLAQARIKGADVYQNTLVSAWSSDGRTAQVTTDRGKFTAAALVITAGPWAAQVFGDSLNLPLQVLRKYVGWFPLRDPATQCADARQLPPYYVETNGDSFYGFPCLDDATMKVAEHSHGEPVVDPAVVDRRQLPSDVVRLQSFVAAHLPALEPTPARHSVCLYTMSPDHHFVIDRHPRFENVSFAAGFSGHGFKFAPVVGEALADFALRNATELPIDFLSLKRFAGGGSCEGIAPRLLQSSRGAGPTRPLDCPGEFEH